MYFPHLPISTISVPGAYTLFPTRAPTATQMAIRMATLGIRSHPANYYPKLPQTRVSLSLSNFLQLPTSSSRCPSSIRAIILHVDPTTCIKLARDVSHLRTAREPRCSIDFCHHPRLSPSHLVRPSCFFEMFFSLSPSCIPSLHPDVSHIRGIFDLTRHEAPLQSRERWKRSGIQRRGKQL